MPIIPYLIGKDVSFAVAPITISALGVITVGSSVSFAGHAERCEERHTRERVNIRPMDKRKANYVPTGDDWTLVLTGIKRAGLVATNPHPLSTIGWAGDHAQITVTTPSEVRVYQGLIGDMGIPTERERSVDELTLIPIDNGGANPTVTPVP